MKQWCELHGLLHFGAILKGNLFDALLELASVGGMGNDHISWDQNKISYLHAQ